MTTQNRYYSNLSQSSFVTNVGGLTAATVSMSVQSSAQWPSAQPFAVRIEPGTANEEVALVTGGAGTSGTPFVITRGYDGTNARIHSPGAPVVPGFCQLDLAEPQQHLNLTGSASGAHGLPSSAWGGPSTPYTPTWAISSGTAPAIGNGTLAGRYFKSGRQVTMFVDLAAGSTTTWGTSGTNYWKFSAPFAAASSVSGNYAGPGFISSASGLCSVASVLNINAGTPYIYLLAGDFSTPGTFDQVGASTYTFNSSSQIAFSVTYESTT